MTTLEGGGDRGHGLRRLENVLNDLAAAAIAVTTVLVVYDVGLATLRLPTYISTEFGPFLMAAIVFFALPLVTRTGQHIRADFLEKPLGARTWAILNVFASGVLFVLYAAVLLGVAAHLTYGSFMAGERTQGVLRTPLWIPQLGMTFGLLLTFLRTLLLLWRDAQNLKDGVAR